MWATRPPNSRRYMPLVLKRPTTLYTLSRAVIRRLSGSSANRNQAMHFANFPVACRMGSCAQNGMLSSSG